jgi:uncharacterized protein YybS (DUF2232 family)
LKNTRLLTEGALLLAVFVVLLLISIYVPILWIISFLFLVLPFILFSAKHPFKYSLLMLIGACILSALLGTFLAVPLALASGTTGIVMGWFIKEKKDKVTLFIASSLTMLVNIVAQYALSIVLFDIDMIQDTIKLMKESFNQSADMLANFGQSVDGEVMEQFNNSIDLIGTLTPTLFLMSAFLLVLLFILVNFPILKRLGIDTPKFKPFREWKLPKSILWYYLLVLVLSITIQPETGSYYYTALINLLYVLQTLMAVQGLAFIFFYSHLKGWSKGLLTLVIIVSIPLLYIVRILGIIDLGFDLRQRLQRK